MPFPVVISREDNSDKVAKQMQSLIDQNTNGGWEFISMDNVQTYVAGSNGCFGMGAQPGYMTVHNVLVFRARQ